MRNHVEADAGWQLADHICRHCCHRVLVGTRADGRTIARCSGCEIEKVGAPEVLCFCGALRADFKTALRCVRNQHMTTEAPDAIVVVEADGNESAGQVDVRYIAIDSVPGKRYFRCDAYRATISDDACATNFRRAQRTSADEWGFMGRCRDCRIGARHAGEALVHRSPLFGLTICPRTRRWAARMIGDRIGVSAFNRQAEVKRGYNAKGTKPLLRLEARRIGVVVNYGTPEARYVEVRDELTRDVIELVIQTLRTIPGRLAFARPRGIASMTTAEMAAELAPGHRKVGRGAMTIVHARRPRKQAVDKTPHELRDAVAGGEAPGRELDVGVAV